MSGFGKYTRTDATDFEVAKVLNTPDELFNRFVSSIKEKRYTTKDTDSTFRVINNWASVGLLGEEDNDNNWHKFSVMDIMFIHIARQLRKFGFSLPKLRIARESLFANLTQPNKELTKKIPLTRLEYAFMRIYALKGGGNTYILVEDDGTATVMAFRDILFSDKLNMIPDSYILINLNALLKRTMKVLNKHEINVYIEPAFWLSNEEIDVLDAVRVKDYDKINIVKKDGKIDTINGIKRFNSEEDVVVPEFGTIIDSIQNGKVVNREVTVKKKLK